MKTTRNTLALLTALSLLGAGSAAAQRRTTDGGGSTGRSTPQASTPSGRSSDGGRSTPSQSGGNSSGSSDRGRGGSTAQPARGSSSTGSSSGSSASGGKIRGIKDRAAAARANHPRIAFGGPIWVGSCWNCGWGYYGGGYGWYHGGYWYPARYPRDYEPTYHERPEVGQGYLDYPYAGDDSSGTTFVRAHATYHRNYGAVSLNGFSDATSNTVAGHVALEGAYGLFRGEFEYGQYSEHTTGATDRMHSFRANVGVLPRLGDRAYLTAGVGVRGLVLDDGAHAWGPELEVGLHVLPVRPLGANVSYRAAGLSWADGSDAFLLSELNTTGSIFFGRVELQAGWHWLKLAGSPAFGGPVAGLKVWF